MAAYCVLRGIDYIVEECPMAAGNRHLGYKDALNAIEERSPGSKAAFYSGSSSGWRRWWPSSASKTGRACTLPRLRGADHGELCAFCRLVARAGDDGRRRPADEPVSRP